ALPQGNHVNIGRLGGYYPLRHYRHCDWLIGNTPHLCDWLITQGFNKKRVVYLPNFVEEKKGQKLSRALFDTPDDAPLILCLGRLHQNKAFDVALEALARLKKAYCWIAGAGPEQQALMNHARQLSIASRVKFLGWRDDPSDLLASADIFLCSSRHEPLGNMVLEAWAQKCPVVAANAQGPSQLIRHDNDGLLCQIDDDCDMAHMLQRLIDNPDLRKNLALQAYRKLQKNFSKSSVTDLYQQFFTQALQKN
ncbi:MAG: glycosyltransferase, partial [Pseudomonadota bacterium]